MTYNGWPNYETWAVSLWLGNDPATEAHVREGLARIREDYRPYEVDDMSLAVYHGAAFVKDYVESIMPDLGASLAADLLGAALSEVKWSEVAKTWLSD